jgi:hypothetical protein
MGADASACALSWHSGKASRAGGLASRAGANVCKGSIPAICRPTGSCASTPERRWIQNGFVWLPEEAHWLDDCMSELAAFPMGRHDDQVDSIAQALAWPKRPSTTGMIDFWAGR